MILLKIDKMKQMIGLYLKFVIIEKEEILRIYLKY